jgi:DNA-binding transcriptional regulator/RsmH inhibitor MraZ
MMDDLFGSQIVRMDDRGRIALPSKLFDTFVEFAKTFGEETDADGCLAVVIGVSLRGKLAVFPKTVHDNLLRYLKAQPSPHPQWDRIRHLVIASKDIQRTDKQNRIKVDSLWAERFNLGGEIVVEGYTDRLELTPKTAWAQAVDTALTNFDDLLTMARMDEVRLPAQG